MPILKMSEEPPNPTGEAKDPGSPQEGDRPEAGGGREEEDGSDDDVEDEDGSDDDVEEEDEEEFSPEGTVCQIISDR